MYFGFQTGGNGAGEGPGRLDTRDARGSGDGFGDLFENLEVLDNNLQRSGGRVGGLMRFGLRNLCSLRLDMLSSNTPCGDRTARGSLERGSMAIQCWREYLECIDDLLNCFEESSAGFVTVKADGLESDVDFDHVGHATDSTFALYFDLEWHDFGP